MLNFGGVNKFHHRFTESLPLPRLSTFGAPDKQPAAFGGDFFGNKNGTKKKEGVNKQKKRLPFVGAQKMFVFCFCLCLFFTY